MQSTKKCLQFLLIVLIVTVIFLSTSLIPVLAVTGDVKLTNPLTNNTSGVDIPTLIGRVINGVLGVVGSLALLMFIYGGLLWMTSAGSDEKVKKGKDILVWATLGLIVIFTSYALVHFIIFQGLGAAGGENPEIDAAQKQNNYQTGN